MQPMPWPAHPFIYEINTWVWLNELSDRLGRPVFLGTVPDEEWDTLAEFGFDAVWLMGVWERSPNGVHIALNDPDLRREFERALPDFREEDVAGSPYCIRGYSVAPELGGPEGLAVARDALARRGLRLVLDYVPNHVATDHPWTVDHPEYFVQGSEQDLVRDPTAFIDIEGNILARGRDPFFPPWQDVVQLNVFDPGLRAAAIETISSIAEQCDGMRCDMAMLLMNDIFGTTWGEHAGPLPNTEYWPEVIDAVRQRYPDVLFIAEAYWDREWDLQQQGFDYCYDKRLYDRLVHDDAQAVHGHLLADIEYQNRLVRFIENHDEARAATALPPLPRQQAAAVAITTLPGAKLLHQGQLKGWRARLPVQIRRRRPETDDPQLQHFYSRLLHIATETDALAGTWRLCDISGWPDNDTHRNLVAWCWDSGEKRRLIVVNDSEVPSQGRVQLPWVDLSGYAFELTERLGGKKLRRDGSEMQEQGLYVGLEGWDCHILDFAGP